MNKKKIVECIVASQVGLRFSANSIFRVHDELLLNGIHLEWVPGGLYLWRLIFPLFDNRPLHLTFSERVDGAGGYISTDGKTDQAIVNEILASPAQEFIRDERLSLGLEEFVTRLRSMPESLSNSHVRMIFAAALLLMKDDASALRNLKSIEGGIHPADKSDHSRLLAAVLSSRDDALNVLDGFVANSSRALGLAGLA